MASNRLWPRSTSLFLVLVGLALSVLSFAVVVNMPELPWHPERDAELRATYESYHDTGVLLVKEAGVGAADLQSPVQGDLTPAAWADDPGAYIVASEMGHVTGSASPYPGLALAMALIVSIPLLWLPTAVARIFRRARAGYALLLLPPLMWLLNQGTILVGTEYGLADGVSPLRVYALPGLAASLAFLSLSILLLFTTFRLRATALVGISLLLAVLAGFGNLLQAFSGIGVAAAVAVLWWRSSAGTSRFVKSLLAGVLAIGVALLIQFAAIAAIDAGRAAASGQTTAELPVAHTTWQQLYRGLSYPEPITGERSTFGVEWAEGTGWDEAREVDPDVVFASEGFDHIFAALFSEKVEADPFGAFKLYLAKTLFVIKHFGAMIAFVVVGFVIAAARRAPQRRSLGAAIAVALPTLLLGFLPSVLVMPMLNSFAQISAALGLLVAVALGALVWSLTSMPAHVRASERTRLSGRVSGPIHAHDHSHLSVVVPTRNGAEVIESTVEDLAGRLQEGDEIIVVENGSTDETTPVLEALAQRWSREPRLVVLHSGPGLGEALRTGVLASTGQRLLLTADDLPFGFTDLDGFLDLPDEAVVAVGSKAHPRSDVTRSPRRMLQSRIFRFLRAGLLQSEVGDSQGTLWVDGGWARTFALHSREMGLMWSTELVLAAEQQRITVHEVPVSLSDAHETGSSRFRFSDAWQSVVGFIRLAVYKDDYCNEAWPARRAAPASVPVAPQS